MFKFIEVFSPPGNSVGKVTYDKINRKFVIWDITGLEIFNIQCTFKCCGKNSYVILYGEEPISDINASKYIFDFSVPRDLQPIQKALIIGGVLLLVSWRLFHFECAFIVFHFSEKYVL